MHSKGNVHTILGIFLNKIIASLKCFSPCLIGWIFNGTGREQWKCYGVTLASRTALLELDKFLPYEPGEAETASAAEDMMEALLEAVAVDCRWDWIVL